MKNPNIVMYHRINTSKHQKINDWYFRRKMIVDINDLYNLIDSYKNKGYKAGNIKQCIENSNYFHLSFDDGFKEHLNLAYFLKEKHKLDHDSVSFSINISNSIKHDYTGMDLVYAILSNKLIDVLNSYLDTDFYPKDIPKIKKHIASLQPEKLVKLSNHFKPLHKQLEGEFLKESEIIELSKLFKVTSHGVTHRFLTNHKKTSEKEVLQSKIILESIINQEVDTFCFPEGKNDADLQSYCKKAGFKYALSIKHQNDNNFCIGRIIN